MSSLNTFTTTSLVFLLFTFNTWAVRVEVEYNDQYHPVIDVGKVIPIIEIDGKRKAIKGSRVRLNKEIKSIVKDGFFELSDRELTIMRSVDFSTGNEYNFQMDFRARLESNRELKNCFLAIDMFPQGGPPSMALVEIPNLKAQKEKKISFSLSLHRLLGEGRYRLYLFSNGDQVLQKSEFFRKKEAGQKKLTKPKELEKDAMPQVIIKNNPVIPKALQGVMFGGSVNLEFTISSMGTPVQIEVISSTHELLEDLAIQAIESATVSPRIKNGKAVPMRIRHLVQFTVPEDQEKGI